MPESIELVINGKPREVSAGQSIAALLQSLELNPKQVAVEVNLDLIPREVHAEHVLSAGDRVEVVSLVGGG